MRVAIPTWQGRVSPVFDTAQQLLIADVENGVETGRTTEALRNEVPSMRAARIAQLRIDVLICGAVSRPLAAMVAATGVEIVPFINGECEQVLAAFLNEQLAGPQFLMPGCCGQGWGRGRGPGRGSGLGAGAGMGRGRRRRGGRGGSW